MFSDSAVDTHCLISGKYVPFKKGVDGNPDKPAHTSWVGYCLTRGQLEIGLTELYVSSSSGASSKGEADSEASSSSEANNEATEANSSEASSEAIKGGGRWKWS